MYAQATLRQLTALEALAARGARTALAERANDDDRAAEDEFPSQIVLPFMEVIHTCFVLILKCIYVCPISLHKRYGTMTSR